LSPGVIDVRDLSDRMFYSPGLWIMSTNRVYRN